MSVVASIVAEDDMGAAWHWLFKALEERRGLANVVKALATGKKSGRALRVCKRMDGVEKEQAFRFVAAVAVVLAEATLIWLSIPRWVCRQQAGVRTCQPPHGPGG